MNLQKINYWTIISTKKGKNKAIHCVCKCVCGNLRTILLSKLLINKPKSCGCQHTRFQTSHGMSRTQIYHTWASMLNRCNESSHEMNMNNYYKRDIRVSEDWKWFENFYKDMGEKPFHNAQIDRIDNNGDYCKENCRWVTPKTNSRNRRKKNIMLEHNGRNIPLAQWAEELNIPYHRIYERYRSGKKTEDILSIKRL